jgi:glycosyltransferase involved in cell wall biosynthesis
VTKPLQSVALDARMIGHSGIGTTLRALLGTWHRNPPPFRLRFLGDAERILHHAPWEQGSEIVQFNRPIYSTARSLGTAPTGDAQVLFAPHYTAPLLPKIPLVATVHDLIHITHPTKRGTAAFMRSYLEGLRRRASYILTTSRHTKVQLQTLHRFEPHRVLTIPLGPGLAGYAEPEPIPPGTLPEGPFVLAAGLFKPHKNWRFMLERLAGLWDRGELALPLAAAGLDPMGRDAVPQIAAQLGHADRVHLVPRLSDGQMVTLYREARALLFPSIVEGFGLPVLEAMTQGTPVVAADLAPMNEIGGFALVTFNPDVPESFDAAVARVVREGADRDAICAAGRRRASDFGWEKYAAGVVSVLQRAWEEHQTKPIPALAE